MKLHNTPTKQLEDFAPADEKIVKLYTCGPTVYNYLHVGNWAAYIYWDILVRTLKANDWDVNRVMNITDVGHLTSDEDEGEDKLQKGARREGKTAWDVAAFYTDDFLQGIEKLGLITPDHITKATDYIDEQFQLIRTLKDKGYTYQISDGIYFDTAKFPTYGDFAGLDIAAQKAGARVEFNQEKRSTSDFALWKFSPENEQRDMEWDTPSDLLEPASTDHKGVSPSSNAKGFPGWHLECSAMAMSIFGDTLDIHTGGIDHIPVHHTNEIAQSEAASGQKFSNFWLHNNHLKVEGTKISKSLNNGYTLQDIAKAGYSALDYKMFVLQAHYRHEGNFTFANLDAAKNRLKNWRNVAALRWQTTGDSTHDIDLTYVKDELNNDLNTPNALTQIDMAFDTITVTNTSVDSLSEAIQIIDDLLGLDLIASTPDISNETKELIAKRHAAREQKDYAKSDELRDALMEQGIAVLDSAHGPIWQYL